MEGFTKIVGERDREASGWNIAYPAMPFARIGPEEQLLPYLPRFWKNFRGSQNSELYWSHLFLSLNHKPISFFQIFQCRASKCANEKRHQKLSLRTPEQVYQNRAKSFRKENVDAFIRNLALVINATPVRKWKKILSPAENNV